MGTDQLNEVTAEDFIPLMNQCITVKFSESVEEELTLVQVALFDQFSPLTRSPFTLILLSEDKTRYYPQGVYLLQHPVKGDLALFMVPLGPNNSGMQYQIILS